MVKETIHIACNIDTSYVKYCIVMLTSLFENNQNVSFHIHVIYQMNVEVRRWSLLKINITKEWNFIM